MRISCASRWRLRGKQTAAFLGKILARQNRGVAEKIGMQFERKTVFKGFPALVFAISREQWLANRAA